MKGKPAIAVITALFLLFTTICSGAEENGAQMQAGDEWSWEPGAYNTFDGEIDLSDYTGHELTICMSTDLIYNDEEKDGRPVFTVLNGKRFTMAKQTETVRCTPDPEDPVVRFSGRLRLPEKKHVNSIGFEFSVTDSSDQPVISIRGSINSNAGDSGRSSGAFYIPVDIHTITLILASAAAIVWAAVLAGSIIRKKKERMGE